MQLKTILNQVPKYKSFDYGKVNWLDTGGIPELEVEIKRKQTANRYVHTALAKPAWGKGSWGKGSDLTFHILSIVRPDPVNCSISRPTPAR